MFVVVIIAFVFIQSEIAIGSAIDPQINGIGFAGSRFHTRAVRNDRASPDKNRHLLKRSFGGDAPTAGFAFTGPEINPVVTRREVNHALGCSLCDYRIDQQRRAKQELVGDCARTRIIGEFERQRAHHGLALIGNAPG